MPAAARRRTAVTDHNDYGPGLRRNAAGRIVAVRNAADSVIEDRDDTTIAGRKVTVRGARRRNAMLELLLRGTIEKHQWQASERFLDDLSLAGGSTPGQRLDGIRTPLQPSTGPAERQVAAIGRVNAAVRVIGGGTTSPFWHVAFMNGALRDYERRHHLRNGPRWRC